VLSPTSGSHLTEVTVWGRFDDGFAIELRGTDGTITLAPGDRLLVEASDNAVSFHMPLDMRGDVAIVSRAGSRETDHGTFALRDVVTAPAAATAIVATAAMPDGTTAMLGSDRGVTVLLQLGAAAAREWRDAPLPLPDGGVADGGGDDGGVADAGRDFPSDAGLPDAGVADGGVVDAGPTGEPPPITGGVVLARAASVPEAIGRTGADGELVHLAAEPDGTLLVAPLGIRADCVFGAGSDDAGAFFWIAEGRALSRIRPDAGWAVDRGPIDLPGGTSCATLAGDGSVFTTWSTTGGGPFDDTATIWGAVLDPGAAAFAERVSIGGPYDDAITFQHRQGTADGHHLVSYCWHDSGFDGDGTMCTGPRVFRAPPGIDETLDVGPRIERRTYPVVGPGAVLWVTPRTGEAIVEVPLALGQSRLLRDTTVGPVVLGADGSFHVPLVEASGVRALVLPPDAAVGE
jgi:hypothetical protein